MACFLAPTVEAIVVTIIKKSVKKKEMSGIQLKANDTIFDNQSKAGFSWSCKLNWLTNLLWGGVFLLAIEHIWHGEVVPWPPFLTAINNPNDIAPMLYEIVTVGVSMAAFVTFIWGIMVLISDKIYKRITTLKKRHTGGVEKCV